MEFMSEIESPVLYPYLAKLLDNYVTAIFQHQYNSKLHSTCLHSHPQISASKLHKKILLVAEENITERYNQSKSREQVTLECPTSTSKTYNTIHTSKVQETPQKW